MPSIPYLADANIVSVTVTMNATIPLYATSPFVQCLASAKSSLVNVGMDSLCGCALYAWIHCVNVGVNVGGYGIIVVQGMVDHVRACMCAACIPVPRIQRNVPIFIFYHPSVLLPCRQLPPPFRPRSVHPFWPPATSVVLPWALQGDAFCRIRLALRTAAWYTRQ